MTNEINNYNFENDPIDLFNDELFQICQEPFTDPKEVVVYVKNADVYLRSRGFYLDHDDLEKLKLSLEDLEEDEAANFLIPIYKDGELSDYNLSVTYFRTDKENYGIDLEVQYFWEDIDLDPKDEFDN